MNRTKGMQKDIDDLTKNWYSISLTQALDKRICVICRKKIIKFKDELSENEYSISGLCQECQDDVFDTEEDE